MRSVESEGCTIDEAIARALAALGAERDRVEIEILENARPGVLGIGRRKARVRARIRAPLEAWVSAGTETEPQAALSSSAAPAAVQAQISRRGAGEGPGDLAALLAEILRLMGIRATVLQRDGQNGERILDVQGSDSGAAVGRRGEVLDALEHLLNRVAERTGNGAGGFVLDADGHRAKRQSALEELARDSAERVRRRRKAVTLDALGPSDRRIVHLALKSEAGVRTRSVGEGLYRKLQVIPVGARRSGGKAKR